ncbi:hypothetical protein [Lonsdalea britannica]|nr:hypothetical protein [Lonsdalea britannica]
MRGWRDLFSGLSPIIDEVISGQKISTWASDAVLKFIPLGRVDAAGITA